MNSSLSPAQVSMMNMILDKELAPFKEDSFAERDYLSSQNWKQLNRSRELGSSTEYSTNNGSSRVLNRIDSNKCFSFQRDTINRSSQLNRTGYSDASMTQNAKIQVDLSELQNRILSMEKTLLQMSSPTKEEFRSPQKKNRGSMTSNQTPANQFTTTESDRNESESLRQNDSSAYLERAHFERKKNSSFIRPKPNSVQKQHHFRAAESDDESDSSFKEEKKQATLSGFKRLNKSTLAEEIQKTRFSQTSHKKKRSLSKTFHSSPPRFPYSQSATKLNYRAMINDTSHAHEIQILNKRINVFKKRTNQSRSSLIKERLRSQDLSRKNEKFAQKLKKLRTDLARYQKIESDYEHLLQSFEKSEFIRNQQKQLIGSLHREIENLRKANS